MGHDVAMRSPVPRRGGSRVVRGRRRSRKVRAAIALLTVGGALLVADAVATVVWKEPVSALLSARQQATLTDDLERLDGRLAQIAPSPAPRETPAQRIASLADTVRRTVRPGAALGRLTIPRIDGSWVVVQGTRARHLRKGPGHYATSSLPGRPGTTAVAGHRTTYGAPFRRIDELVAGDRIVAKMPYGTFTYRVEGSRIVRPSQVGVLRDIGRPRLVLTACHPLYSAEKRIIVFARLVRAAPRGAARRS